MPELTCRRAELHDVPVVARMNHRLIRDEGHRNRRMSVEELARRMTGWLASGEYEATLFLIDDEAAGYALYRRESEHVYVRQFYVRPEVRRQGIGRQAMAWLLDHAWPGMQRVRIDVLLGNSVGQAFWRAVGFEPYCLTMERPIHATPPREIDNQA